MPRHSITTWLGADFPLMRQLKANKAMSRYRLAALALAVVTVFTFCSVRYAMDLLFHMPVVEWTLAVFISTLFMLMYMLLINTFTKASFSATHFFTLSNIGRLVFVLFMAFIISKPAEVFLLRNSNAPAVEAYKASLVNSFTRQVNDLHSPDIKKLEQRSVVLNHQQQIYPSIDAAAELQATNNDIATIQTEEASSITAAQQLIDESSFMLYRMKLAGNNGGAVFFSLLVMLLFMAPGYLIYSLPATDPYIIAKKEREKAIIAAAFSNFLKSYHHIFHNKLKLKNVTYYTVFSDPPFNNIRKPKPKGGSNNDFLDKWGPLY